jgi:hypothetical protein
VTGSISLLRGLAGLDWRFRSRVDQVLAFPLDRRGAISVLDLRLGYQILGTALLVKVANLLQSRYVDVEERNQGAPRSVMVTAFRAF